MSVDIKKRFDRIVEILIQLQSKRVVKAQELADRFDVSLRTIYRDIKSLEQAGVPLIGEAGMGYSIMDGYRLPPVSFSKEEALCFVATEKLAEKYLDQAGFSLYSSALMKIKAILKSNDQDMVTNMQEQIIMRKQHVPIFPEKVPHVLSTAIEAIANKTQIQIEYQGIKDDEAILRIIEPIGIVHEIGFWYIVAYCLQRMDFRQFRSDRIAQVTPLENKFSKRHISIGEYMSNQKSPELPKIKSKILVSRDFAPFMRWQRNTYGFISEAKVGDKIEMVFESRDIEHEFPRWLMMFGDKIEIKEPEELKHSFNKLFQAIQNNIK